MGPRMGLLAALVALLCICICPPAGGAEGCGGFRHLDNGRTFFRYGGLLVIFRCHPGYKLHGYKTNSCVSGHWSRDPPVCVGSGCSDPGLLPHGTSSMNEDGSWAVFSCNSGFQLLGPSMLYCKGHTWNSTKPVCKESDMMSLISSVSVQKPNIHQNLQAAVVLKTQQQSDNDTLANNSSEEGKLESGLLSHAPNQLSNSDRIEVTSPQVHLQQHILFPSFKVKDGVQTFQHEAQVQAVNKTQGPKTGTGRNGSVAKASDEKSEKADKVTQMTPTKPHLSTTMPTTLSLVSGTEQSASSLPTFSAAHTAAMTAVTNTAVEHPLSAVIEFGGPVTSPDFVTPSDVVTDSSQNADEDHQAETGSRYPPLSPPGSVDEEEPADTPTYTLPPSVYSIPAGSSSPSSPTSPALFLSPPLSSLSASTSASPKSTTQSSTKTQMPNVTLRTNTPATSGASSGWTELHNLTVNASSSSSSRQPACPDPPVPIHGTFHFHTVESPGARVYRQYIQYACYPGYTLAHGDTQSYCQQDGTWSGITPVCLELTPCSVNNGGCSQLCSHSQYYNQSSNQTQTRTQCHCRPGFTLLDDRQTCRDVDECLLPAAVTGCVFGCVNTPGSFHCRCPVGYNLPTVDSHCQDIDECAVNQGLGPCMEQCHNSPGSYRCSCTYGHILAGDGHSCIAECPPGYRKQPTTAENSTAQALKDECVDINECQEERCAWQCVNLPGSYRCICPKGYALQGDGQRCEDINECSRKNGGCSHLCVNQKSGYKCACPASHRLSPYSWKKCVPRTTANTAG